MTPSEDELILELLESHLQAHKIVTGWNLITALQED